MSLRVRLALVVAITFAIVVVGCVFAAHVSASHELRAETDRFLAATRRATRASTGLATSADRGPGLRLRQRPRARASPSPTRSCSSSTQRRQRRRHRARRASGRRARPRDCAANRPAIRALPHGHGRRHDLPHAHRAGADSGAAQIAREHRGDQQRPVDARPPPPAHRARRARSSPRCSRGSSRAASCARSSGSPPRPSTWPRTQDLDEHDRVDRHDELGRLASSFNTMLVALRDSRDQQKRLVMDASHELRTPLTALRTNIDVLQRSPALDATPDATSCSARSQVELRRAHRAGRPSSSISRPTRAPRSRCKPSTSASSPSTSSTRVRRRTGRDDHADPRRRRRPSRRGAPRSSARSSNLVDNACKFSARRTPVDVRRRAAPRSRSSTAGPGISDRGPRPRVRPLLPRARRAHDARLRARASRS